MPYQPTTATVVTDETCIFEFNAAKYVLTGFYEAQSALCPEYWTVMKVVRREKTWITDGDVCDFDGSLVEKLVSAEHLPDLKKKLVGKAAPLPSGDCGCG